MRGLMMDSIDGRHVEGLDEAYAVPVPPATRSWQPVSNKQFVEEVRDQSSMLGLPIYSEQYGLASKDQQLFGVITFDTGQEDNGLAIGLRNSYNKTLSLGITSGASVFVCSNLCFSGDATRVIRKHTRYVWRDAVRLIHESIEWSQFYYDQINEDFAIMKGQSMTNDNGYDLIGRALGYEVLKPQQATVAMREWKNPSHEEFLDRNTWCLYNAFTEALKKGCGGNRMEKQAKAHQFLMAA